MLRNRVSIRVFGKEEAEKVQRIMDKVLNKGRVIEVNIPCDNSKMYRISAYINIFEKIRLQRELTKVYKEELVTL